MRIPRTTTDFKNNRANENEHPVLFLPDRRDVEAEQLQENYWEIIKEEPERAAQILRLARNYRRHPKDIAEDLENAKLALEAPKREDWKTFRQNYPNTAKWLRDPKNMATVKDLFPELQSHENIFKQIKKGYQSGKLNVEYSELRWAQTLETLATGKLSTKGEERIKEIEALMAEVVRPSVAPLYFVGEQIPNYLFMAKKGGILAAAGGVLGGLAALGAGAFIPAPEEAVTVPVGVAGGMKLGAKIGGNIGVAEASAILEGGSAFGEFLNIRDKEGNPIDPQLAAVAALAVGLINAGLEYASARLLLRTIPGGDKILNFMAKKEVKELAKKRTSKSILIEGVKRYLQSIAGEVTEEILQETVTSTTGAILEGKPLNLETVGEVARRALQVVSPTIQSSMIFGLPGLGSYTVHGLRQISQAKMDAQIYQSLGEVAANSKFLERYPEGFRELVELHTQGEIENIYIDTENLMTFFQEAIPDIPAEQSLQMVAEELGISEQLQEAIDTNKPLRIPYAVWLEKVVKTPLYKQMEQHIKFSEEGLTLFQAQEEEKRVGEMIAEEQKRVEKYIKSNESLQLGYDTVYNDIKEKLIAAGRPKVEAEAGAKLWASYAVAESVRRNINPIEWYMGRNKPEIRTEEFKQQEGTFNQAANIEGLGENQGSTFYQTDTESEAFKKWFGDSKVVDEQGKPLVVYHNTTEQFSKFDITRARQGVEIPGFFFSDNPTSWADMGEQQIQAYLSIKNPFIGDYSNYKGIKGGTSFSAYQKIREALIKDGYDGIIIKEEGEDGEYIAFFPEQIKSIYNRGTFDPNDPNIFMQDINAQVTINKEQSVITLFKTANASSFLHESAHMFLNDTFEFVKSGQADEEYLNYWSKIAKHLDVKEDQETLTTEQQEKFAREFEAYLREGKAPSEGLRKAFAAFRRWLTRIYRDITGLGVEVTDEVREIMDRMLATEEEIREREIYNGYDKDLIKESDVSPATWRKYQDLKEKAHEMAIEQLLKPQMEELKPEYNEWLQQERERVREIIEKEVADLPIYKVMEAVRMALKFRKRDIKDLARRYLENNDLTNEAIAVFESVAEAYGYSSGDHLAKEIINAPLFVDEVNDRVEMHMAQYADLRERADIKYEAEKAVRNDGRLDLMSLEWAILRELIEKEELSQAVRQRTLERARIHAAAAKRYAKAILANKPYREAQAATSYFAAERNAAIKEAGYYNAKDYEKAAKYAEQRILNHALATEALRIQKVTEKWIKFLKTTQKKRKDLFKKEEHFVQVASILNRIGLPVKDYSPDMKQETLAAWSERMDKITEGDVTNTVSIADWLKNETIIKNYKDLTVNELQDVVNAIRNITTIANYENRTYRIEKGEEISKIVSNLSLAAAENVKKEYKDTMEPGKYDNIKKAARKFNIDLKRPQTIIQEMDGWKENGVWYRTFIEPVYQQANFESNMMLKFNTELEKLWSIYTRKERDQMINNKKYYDELKTSTTKIRLIVMALNMGNETNMEKLCNTPPIGVNADWGPDTLKALMEKNLTAKDWKFVQGVWNLINKLWPDVSKMHRELTGFEPEKVEARPFSILTADGQIVNLEGGYFPLKEDTRASWEAESREIMSSPLYTEQNPGWRAMTKTGHTKKRTGAQYPVALDITLINRHIKDVIHDLAFRPVVIDLKKIVNNKEFQQMAKTKMSAEGYKALKNWISGVAARSDAEAQGLSGLEYITRQCRNRASTAILLFKPAVIIQNLANPLIFSDAIEGFGRRQAFNAFFIRGIMDYIPKAAFDWKAARAIREEVYAKSAFMRDLANNPDYSLNVLHDKMFGKDNKLKEFGLAMMAWTDNLTSIPMWLEAYNQKLNETNNEYEAVKYADRLIDTVMGSGRKYDQAAIFRGNEFQKSLTMFYSFMNVQYNRFLKEQGIYKTTKNTPRFLGYIAGNIIIFTIASELLAGRGPDDDEDEITWYLREILGAPIQWIPGVRELAGVALDKILGLHSYGYRPNPLISQFENILNVFGEIRQFVEGDSSEIELLEAGGKAASFIAPYPQIFNDWFFNAIDYVENDMSPQVEDFYRRRRRSER